MMAGLVERLRDGLIERQKRWSGDTHDDLGGSVDYDATDALMDEAADCIAALEAENAALREALGGASETGRGYTLKKIREDLESCGFSGKDAELVITYLLNSGLIQIGQDMIARAALARQTEGEG